MAVDDCQEKLLLRAELGVDGTTGEACGVGYLLECRAGEALAGEIPRPELGLYTLLYLKYIYVYRKAGHVGARSLAHYKDRIGSALAGM